jgi:DNA invertase Pin-like site-specific DNA recombinase
MTSVGYARVSSIGQELDVQIEKLAMCERVFKEKQSAVDADRPELRRCLDYLREGDTLLVTKIDRLARSTSDLYRLFPLSLRRVLHLRLSTIRASTPHLAPANWL